MGILFLLTQISVGQTNPPAQNIPYTQDFSNNWFTSAGIPAGFAIWKAASAPRTSNTSAALSSPSNDELAFDSATVVKSNGNAYGYSGVSGGGTAINNGQLYIQTSSTSSGTDQMVLAINTTGYSNITISFDVEMINPQPKLTGFVLQFRIGTTGSFTTIDSSYWHNSSDRLQNQVDHFINLLLPGIVDNKSMVQLRWALSRNPVPVGAGSCGIAFDNIIINGTIDSPNHYRSIQSGNWNSLSSWESSNDSIIWNPAFRIPNSTERSIRIRTPHTIKTESMSNLVIDETTIEEGATLWNSYGTSLGINDGPDSVDLDIKGTFVDSSNYSVVWENSSTWRMESAASYIKTTNTNSTNWQLHYFNGISNIPSTSNWICRKPAGAINEPSISTTNGGPPNPQVYYGNLYIENYSGFWNSNNLCKFSGSVNYPIIKGNLFIGGNSTNPINFHISNSNTLPVSVLGNVVINPNNTLTVTGTGLEIGGNLNCAGLYTHVNSSSKLLFSGSTGQSIQGNGIVETYKLEINKPAGELDILKDVNVYGNLNLLSGRVNTFPSSKIIIQNDATSTGASNLSFIRGPVKKIGDDAFRFPVGKGNDFQPIAIDAGINSLSTDAFTAEYFYVDPQTVYGSTLGPGVLSISDCEYWTLNMDSGNAQKKVTLWWDTHSCGILNLNDLRVARYDSMWMNAGMTQLTGAISFGNITSSYTGNYGPFTFAMVNPHQVNLPVSLLSFDAVYDGKEVILKWETASEINNQSFTVQRKTDETSFEDLFSVPGAGNSTTMNSYSGADQNPLPGISYYRLKQNDYDGRSSYSGIIPIKIRKAGTEIVSLISSRENGNVQLDLAFAYPTSGIVEVKDPGGKTIALNEFTTQETNRHFIFNTGNISRGIYFMRITTPKDILIRKFMY